MTAKEMFEALDYELIINRGSVIEYIDDSHGDGDYVYVRFYPMYKEYEIGYFDGYETKTKVATGVSIKEHEAITKQMKELGWI